MDLEKKVDLNKKNIETLKDVVIQLLQLSDGHTDQIGRLLFSIAELRESQKDTQGKLDALIDAQIRGEDQMRELREVVKSAHQRIDKIEQK